MTSKASRQSLSGFGLLVAALVLPRMLFWCIWSGDSLSADYRSWNEVVAVLQAGGNPYNETTRLNWPPFWMQILYAFSLFKQHFALAVSDAVFFLLVFCEVLILAVLFFLFKTHRRLLLFGLCLNPALILLTVAHGNFDVMVGLWVLLFMFFLLRFTASAESQDWLMACLFLGLGILTKTVPVVCLALLSIGTRKLDRRTLALGAGLLFIPVTLGMSVLLALGEEPVLRNVIQYRSIPFHFGIPGWISVFSDVSSGFGSRLLSCYTSLFFVFLLASLVWISGRLSKGGNPAPGALLCLGACLLAALPALGPGYGSQYLYWFWPLLLVIYQGSSSREQVMLKLLYLVVLLTYLVDYGLNPAYGAFLFPFLGKTHAAARDLALEPLSASLLHLPLFLSYAAFILWGIRRRVLSVTR